MSGGGPRAGPLGWRAIIAGGVRPSAQSAPAVPVVPHPASSDPGHTVLRGLADPRPVALPALLALFDPAAPGDAWRLVSDGVMGGVSCGTLRPEVVAGRPALRLQGEVRLENNGGFLQVAADLAPGGAAFDASDWTGLAIDICGPAERYGLHLRTTDLTRPWQSFRADLAITADWQRHILPFTQFQPHRTDAALDPRRLRRVGLIAIGRAFRADVAMGGLWLYRAAVRSPPAR